MSVQSAKVYGHDGMRQGGADRDRHHDQQQRVRRHRHPDHGWYSTLGSTALNGTEAARNRALSCHRLLLYSKFALPTAAESCSCVPTHTNPVGLVYPFAASFAQTPTAVLVINSDRMQTNSPTTPTHSLHTYFYYHYVHFTAFAKFVDFRGSHIFLHFI